MRFQTVDVICHAHADAAYRENPAVEKIRQRQYLDSALRRIENTGKEPEDARFCWSCETTAPVADFIEHADKLQQKAFLMDATERSMDIEGFAYSFHTMAGSDESRENLTWLRPELWRALSIRTVVQNGVGGVQTAMMRDACEKGVRYLWVGLADSVKSPRPTPYIFNWKLSADARVLTWVNDGFGTLNELLSEEGRILPAEKLFDVSEENLKLRAAFLAENLLRWEKSLPEWVTTVPVSFTGGYRKNDPDGWEKISGFVRAWNEAGLQPRLRLSTFTKAFDTLQASLANAPLATYSGEWYDSLGRDVMSMPDAVSAAKKTRCLLNSLRRIPTYDAKASAAEEKEIIRALCYFDEPSYAGAPGCTESKLASVYSAKAKAEFLYTENRKVYFAAADRNKLFVQNTSNVALTDYVRIPKHRTSSRYRSVVDENTGKRIRLEPEGDCVRLWVELAPGALHSYHFTEKEAEPSYDDNGLQLSFDELGCPVSFQWVRGKLDLPFVGEFFSRSVTFGDPKAVSENLRAGMKTDDSGLYTAEIGALYAPAQKEEAEHAVIFSQKFSHPALLSGERVIMVWKGTPRISVWVNLERKPSLEPEMFHLKFDFGRKIGSAFASLGGEPFEIGRGQLFNSCNDFCVVDDGISFPHEGILFCTKDSPVVSFGSDRFFENAEEKPRNFSPLYSCVFNSYVGEKYPKNLAGKTSFRYDILLASDVDDFAKVREVCNSLNGGLLVHDTLR